MLAEWTSKWIKVVDNKNDVVIDVFDYTNGIHGPVITKHCVKCIAANQCWFMDKKNKKPEPMEYSIEEILKDTKHKRGLYHYNCHCKEIDIPAPNESDIKLIIPEGKIGWLFRDKSDWIRSLGHEPNNEFVENIKRKVVESYCLGKYKIRNIDNFGVRVTVYIEINGGNEKLSKTYSLKSGFTIFSNGKLKCNTLIGGK